MCHPVRRCRHSILVKQNSLGYRVVDHHVKRPTGRLRANDTDLFPRITVVLLGALQVLFAAGLPNLPAKKNHDAPITIESHGVIGALSRRAHSRRLHPIHTVLGLADKGQRAHL
jgi:hypothetical protein